MDECIPSYEELELTYEEQTILKSSDAPRPQLNEEEVKSLIETLKDFQIMKSNIVLQNHLHLSLLCK